MLQELKVSQFALIDSLNIEFKPKLNIISGETGSGKSVLLKSLALLMGEKASTDIIRTGSLQATVEGLFDLRDRPDIKNVLTSFSIDCEDDQLVVKRVIAQNDKSKVYLNGSLSTLSQLKEIVSPMIEVTGQNSPLLEMTGQHDNRNLLSKVYHLDLLDQYIGLMPKRQVYAQSYESLIQIKNEILHLEKTGRDKNQKLDFLKFQLQELEQLEIDPVQDSALEEEIRKLKSSHKIIKFVEDCEDMLFNDSESIGTKLKFIQKKAIELNIHQNSDFKLSLQNLEQARILLEDSIYSMRKNANAIPQDANSLESKEVRLSQIRKLQKKYGPDLNEISVIQKKLFAEVSDLENFDHVTEQKRKQSLQLELSLKKSAEELHNLRTEHANKLSDAVNVELTDLNMKGVSFSIQTAKLPELGPYGISDIEFLCQTSPKDPLRPIAKIASGGELSRILLSLKKSLGKSEMPRTYLFDEVDTGVSGNTAEKVGKKLKSIAQNQQVICVTHLPQVAACGDVHFSIHKTTDDSTGVHMHVTELKSKSRINEIARLISGEKITKTSLAHAEQLLSESLG